MGWAICWVDIGYCNTDLALWTDRAMSRVGENFKGRENSAGENRRPRQCGEKFVRACWSALAVDRFSNIAVKKQQLVYTRRINY